MRCAIYCRLSREDDEKSMESESIQNQKSMLIKYAEEQGWDIYKIYCDEDFSGTDSLRPDFIKMIADAKTHRFDIILCKTQSRFTRDMELVEKYIHGKFPIWKIRFIALVDNVDTDVKGNKKARQINGLINEWYLEDLSENIKTVFDYKRKNGIHIGSFPLYGYEKHPSEKGKLVIDSYAAEVVRNIFHLSLNGYGKARIASMLNDMDILNPTKYKQMRGWNYVNGGEKAELSLWNKTTISRILHNEMYLGTMVQGRRYKPSYKSNVLIELPPESWIKVENTHEAIIERETFEQIQKQMEKRTRTDGSGAFHVLSKKVFCLDCGSTMSKTTNEYKGIKRAYLRCQLSARTSNGKMCSRHSIRLDDLIEIIENKIREYIECCRAQIDLSRIIKDNQLDTPEIKLQFDLQSIQNEIKKRSAALRALYLDKAAGIIETNEFIEMKEAFHEEKIKLEKQAIYLSKKVNHSSIVDENTKCTALNAFLDFETLSYALIHLFIKKIEIGEKDPISGTQHIIIHWNF